MKNFIFFLFPICLFSCRISMNKDSYLSLKKSELQKIQKFDGAISSERVFQSVEVVASDLNYFIEKNNYTLIHLFSPWCGPCREILKKELIFCEQTFKNKGMKLVVVSNQYDNSGSTKKFFEKIAYASPIYIMDNKTYGSDLDIKHRAFGADLAPEAKPYQTVSSFYLFDNSRNLIYYNYNPPSIDTLTKLLKYSALIQVHSTKKP